jgi:hypothetical protein
MSNISKRSDDHPVLYIMVIGFHHKKGCQLEYVYPLDDDFRAMSEIEMNDTSKETSLLNPNIYKLPKQWKHLPSLSLPDGSHNYESDYVYFHLEDFAETAVEDESLNDQTKKQKNRIRPKKTVFGVSSYRQMNATDLIHKDTEVTRNTLQKSVCIICQYPTYGNFFRNI